MPSPRQSTDFSPARVQAVGWARIIRDRFTEIAEALEAPACPADSIALAIATTEATFAAYMGKAEWALQTNVLLELVMGAADSCAHGQQLDAAVDEVLAFFGVWSRHGDRVRRDKVENAVRAWGAKGPHARWPALAELIDSTGLRPGATSKNPTPPETLRHDFNEWRRTPTGQLLKQKLAARKAR